MPTLSPVSATLHEAPPLSPYQVLPSVCFSCPPADMAKKTFSSTTFAQQTPKLWGGWHVSRFSSVVKHNIVSAALHSADVNMSARQILSRRRWQRMEAPVERRGSQKGGVGLADALTCRQSHSRDRDRSPTKKAKGSSYSRAFHTTNGHIHASLSFHRRVYQRLHSLPSSTSQASCTGLGSDRLLFHCF